MLPPKVEPFDKNRLLRTICVTQPTQAELDHCVVLTTVDKVLNYGRGWSFRPVTFGLACCAIEIDVLRWGAFRPGAFWLRSFPSIATSRGLAMIVAGTVTKKDGAAH